MTMLSHYMGSNQNSRSGDDDTVSYSNGFSASFAQQNKKIVCYKCGKPGHIASQCGNVSDDDTIGSAHSTRSMNRRQLEWSD